MLPQTQDRRGRERLVGRTGGYRYNVEQARDSVEGNEDLQAGDLVQGAVDGIQIAEDVELVPFFAESGPRGREPEQRSALEDRRVDEAALRESDGVDDVVQSDLARFHVLELGLDDLQELWRGLQAGGRLVRREGGVRFVAVDERCHVGLLLNGNRDGRALLRRRLPKVGELRLTERVEPVPRRCDEAALDQEQLALFAP